MPLVCREMTLSHLGFLVPVSSTMMGEPAGEDPPLRGVLLWFLPGSVITGNTSENVQGSFGGESRPIYDQPVKRTASSPGLFLT